MGEMDFASARASKVGVFGHVFRPGSLEASFLAMAGTWIKGTLPPRRCP